MRQPLQIYTCGESVLTIQLTDIISPEAHRAVMALATYLHDEAFPFVQDIIPAYTGVSVVIDPIAFLQQYPDQIPEQWLQVQLHNWQWSAEQLVEHPIKKIPVLY